MVGYWPGLFIIIILWAETKSRSTKTQERTRPISNHLDPTSLVDTEFITDMAKRYSLLREQAGTPERAR